MIKTYLHYAVAAAFYIASGTSNVAFAVVENEAEGAEGANDSPASAQHLVIGSDGTVEVTGAIGTTSPLPAPAIPDVDFYSFDGRAGDLVTIDIDRAWKSEGRSLDSWVAIYLPGPELAILRQKDDGIPLDLGSAKTFDSRIDEVSLPVDGKYFVGVTNAPRQFLPGGTVTPYVPGRTLANGSYTLIISGVTAPPLEQHMNIEIKPGADSIKPPLNPKSKGNIPVALLSSPDFDALKVDIASITFGPTGVEAKVLRCGKGGEDVNADRLLDLVCHFENQDAKFQPHHEEGTVKGTIAGRPFKGTGWLKIIPVKKED